MSDDSYIRWYDGDPVVAKCIGLLEGVRDSLKRQTATFLMGQIILKPPYSDMLPDEVFNLITSETRKRRWYDFDETIKIFMELLRHSSEEVRRQICITAITFIEDISLDKNRKIEIPAEE